jgi:adenylate kinase family enzyme
VKPFVLAFSGSIGSGKTTLSLSIAKALNWPYISFGNYVRTVALLRGLGESREVLQEVGESLIQEGWKQFCKSTLAQATWEPGQFLVIDGIRHVEAVEMLRLLVMPSELLHIHIMVNDFTRKTRLDRRSPADYANMQSIEDHSTEVQVKGQLPQIANLIVAGERSIDDIIHEILMRIKNYIAQQQV